MRHADFEHRLRPRFHPRGAGKTQNIGNSQPLDFYAFPNLETERAALQLNWPMALPFQVLEDSTSARRANRKLLQKAFVSFE
ncbi:MAG: hypothetical protein IH623_32335 [Verrucomicrobia bacterium]|nr:hypothetical protein [Verrucomicrobiota bacterium]